MARGMRIQPGGGELIRIGALELDMKVSAQDSPYTSTFEVRVPPGFDVGAHRHESTEELFYVLEGELDLLAFEPADYGVPRWQDWVSGTGERVLRAKAGTVMYVPPGCPHAFGNPGDKPARMLFQASPAGHEEYLRELGAQFTGEAPPDMAKIVEIRKRHGIEQLTEIAAPTSV
ncbi:cupin domain-containing protein [Nocardia sp. NBC_01499]|uniref:cupin domain-containing protein n=1 Tax=Nocardia sp. NBC_01499 TaxID=2903597 RepID=UPI003866163B